VFVVDLSDNVAGRFCAKLLGMGGADVVRPSAAERTASVPFLHAYLSASTRSTTDPVDALIADAIAKSGATSIKEMGKAMALLKQSAQGRADMAQVSAKLKAKLGG